MILPRNDQAPQPPLSSAPCPWCGYRPVPYDQRRSDLLDTVALLMAVVQDLKKAAEEVQA